MNDHPVPSASRAKMRSFLWFLLRLGAAGGLIFWLVHTHLGEFQTAFTRLSYACLALALSIYAGQVLIGARRWRALLKIAGFEVTVFEATELTLKASFCSLFIPGGPLGGDVAKIGFLATRTAKGERFEGALTILMDRIVGMVGLFLLALVLLVWKLPLFLSVEIPGVTLNHGWRICGVALLAGVCVGGLAAMLALFFHATLRRIGWIDRLFRLGDRWSRGLVTRLTALFDCYARSWRTLTLWALISLMFIHYANVVAVYAVIAGLGVIHFAPVTVAAAVVVGNIAGLLPVTLSGLGLRDMVICSLLAAGGVPDQAVIPLLYSAVIILFNLLAGGVFLYDASSRKYSGRHNS
ncbi:hypothetical protein SDC9_68225 [bioreactor metagenome]|uniref:Lysylphosphatidylglycerol synthase TM region n=1 Tax=bioreactor metagenome TaxID=1076179 RepID=A0A644XZW8_9ZZZZ